MSQFHADACKGDHQTTNQDLQSNLKGHYMVPRISLKIHICSTYF